MVPVLFCGQVAEKSTTLWPLAATVYDFVLAVQPVGRFETLTVPEPDGTLPMVYVPLAAVVATWLPPPLGVAVTVTPPSGAVPPDVTVPLMLPVPCGPGEELHAAAATAVKAMAMIERVVTFQILG
jgi:hypothetical protein